MIQIYGFKYMIQIQNHNTKTDMILIHSTDAYKDTGTYVNVKDTFNTAK